MLLWKFGMCDWDLKMQGWFPAHTWGTCLAGEQTLSCLEISLPSWNQEVLSDVDQREGIILRAIFPKEKKWVQTNGAPPEIRCKRIVASEVGDTFIAGIYKILKELTEIIKARWY
jgi:hypothetical protein